MRSLGVLIVRLVVGGLLAGHGAQKLFGWFGGAGPDGTARYMESMGLRPGGFWGRVAGGSELGGGLLTALGFLNPLGPIAAIGAMSMAWAKVHLGNPVWSTKGGAELVTTNLAVLAALTITGPGRLSLDSLFGIRVPRRIAFGALAATLGAVYVIARPEIDAGTAKVNAVGVETEREATEHTAAEDDGAVRAGDVATGSYGGDVIEGRPWEGADFGSETPEAV